MIQDSLTELGDIGPVEDVCFSCVASGVQLIVFSWASKMALDTFIWLLNCSLCVYNWPPIWLKTIQAHVMTVYAFIIRKKEIKGIISNLRLSLNCLQKLSCRFRGLFFFKVENNWYICLNFGPLWTNRLELSLLTVLFNGNVWNILDK